MHTIALPPEHLPEFTQLFQAISCLKTTNEYEFGRYKAGDLHVVIYNSGKVVFSHKPRGQLRDKIIEFLISHDEFDGYVIGSDEAGKGELLGPIVVAAVLLRTREERALARFEGAMDSKELSKAQLGEISKFARKCKHAIRVLSPQDFNAQFRGGNLNDLLAGMHISAISRILEDTISESGEKCTIIIDKFGGRKNDVGLENELKRVHPGIDIIITTRGERFEPVAMASIIAKSEYEKWLDSYEAQEGLGIRKLAKDKIAVHKKRNEFCKVSYLNAHKRGGVLDA
ncbi:MAG: hypothetical protein N3G76_00965 [Candidatus Micrarchaeota archaeon]|nr:hypothetical protein [Candidatus Micrarchaeota archaeon]